MAGTPRTKRPCTIPMVASRWWSSITKARRPRSTQRHHLRNRQGLVFTAVCRTLCYHPGQSSKKPGGVMTTALRPLSTGELLDRTFSLYRSHFGLFLAIFALPHLVVLAFQCGGLAFESPTPQLSNILITMVWTIGAAFLSLASTAASQAATVIAVSEVHLGRPAGIAQSFSRVKGEILPVIGLSLVIGMAAGA